MHLSEQILEREPLTRHRTEVLMLLFIVFRNFLYFAQSRGSFDAIAFLLAASRSRIPFFNSELILGAFFALARLVQSGP